jgi:serine/threonine protein phosphatase PrpC
MGEPAAVRCGSCGEEVGPKDRFCESCGHSLLVQRTPVGGALGTPPESPACVACGGPNLGAEGFCEDCGRAQPAGRDRMEAEFGAVVGVCDKGKRRARNEDSMAFGVVSGNVDGTETGEPTVVAVVCDGVATSDRADSASQAAVDEATDVLLNAVLDGGDLEAATKAAVAKAIEVVSALADPAVPGTAPSCTYVSTVVTQEAAVVGWVGDSRIYWLGLGDEATDSTVLTSDDTVAAELIAEGMNETEALAVHQAHALSKWIGADAGEIEPGVRTFKPTGPGLVLLCSDGLWNYLPEARALTDALPADVLTDPMSAAKELTDLALRLGGHDNITTVLVPFPPQSEPRSE